MYLTNNSDYSREDPTSISFAEYDDHNQYPTGIYDLQGRKVADENLSTTQLPKGVYIVNGKKIVVR